MKKRKLYTTLLVISVIFLPFLFQKIGQCEEESYGWYGENNIEGLLSLSGLFILVEFVIFSIDNLIILIKKMIKREVNNSELFCLIGAIIMFILWILVVGKYSGNGTCDLIIGPADTGLFLAMLIISIINLWKVKSIKKIDNNT